MTHDNRKSQLDDATFGAPVPAEGGLVERLLDAAGSGPEIPEGGAERVKAAIRSSWQDEVAINARQRRRLWAGGLAAAAALVIAVVLVPRLQRDSAPTGPTAITAAVINGGLEVTPPGSTASILGPADAGSVIPDGSLVRTRPGQRASLWLAGGQSLRIDDETVARLDSERSISLDSGAVYISSAGGIESGVEVRTAFGTATDIGTQFEVRFENDSLDVSVREGLVSLARGSDEYQIADGIRFSVDSGGAVTTTPVLTYDPAWGWCQSIAPAFEIEGRSALAFLDWVSVETGLSVRFADASVEKLAATTLLHGTITGLKPAESPAAVLPTCGLTAVEESGVLLVQRIDANKGRQ
jgi:ferric-dicitrate binding protein FerR (iron transport regulator)